MRKPLILLLSLLFLVSAAAAITIEKPDSRVYLDEAISLEVSDASEPVNYSLNRGENQSCGCVEEVKAIIAPDGENLLQMYNVNGQVESDSVSFTVDTSPPSVASQSPEGTIYDTGPELRLDYSDVSSVEVDSVQVRLDGDAVNGSAGQESFNATLANLSEGNHTVSYNIPDEHWRTAVNHNATGSWNFTLPVEPVVTGSAPHGVVDSSPSIELTARDPSSIDMGESYIEISGPEERRVEWDEAGNATLPVDNGIEFFQRFEGLEDGVYTVKAHVEDGNGNAAETSWSFTVDTSPPELAFHSHLSGDVVKSRETFEFNVSDLTEVERVNLSLGNLTAEASHSGGLYTATVDTRTLSDGDATLTVTAEDGSGHSVTESILLTVDNNEPVIEDIEYYPDPAVRGLEITATVRDSATRIIGARYRIKKLGEEVLSRGRLESVVGEYDSQEEQVRAVADLGALNLSTGNYTALLLTEDSAGHQYGWFGKSFRVDNGLEAELAVEEKVFRQEIGTSQTFTFRVSNTGGVDELVTASSESELDTSVSPDRKRIQAGETKQFNLEVSMPDNESYIGNHTVTLTVEGLSSSDTYTAEVIGQPHSERREEIEARFQELKQELSDLNQSRNEWDFGGEVEQGFERTSELVAEVERLLEEGRYARAEEKLAEAEQELRSTRNTFTGQVTRARLGSLASAAVKLLALAAVLGILYGGYRIIPPEEGYHPERGYTHRPGGKHPLRFQVEHRWNRFRERLGEMKERETGEEREEKTVERWEGYGN